MKRKGSKSTEQQALSIEDELTSFQQALLDEMTREITVRGANGTETIPANQALARKALQKALSGSPHALNLLFRNTIDAEKKAARKIKDDIEFGIRFKDHQTELLKDAINRGEDPEKVLPHPDDIDIIEGKGFVLRGPLDEDQLESLKVNCRLRDTLILQHFLENRFDWPPQPETEFGDSQAASRGSALILACLLNDTLPKRFRLSDGEWFMMEFNHKRKTKRELLRETRQAWAAIGQRKPRGWLTPPFIEIYNLLNRMMPALGKIITDISSGKLTDDRETASRIQQVFDN